MIFSWKSLRVPAAAAWVALSGGCAEEPAKAPAGLVGNPYPHPVKTVTGSPYQALDPVDNHQGVERDLSLARGPHTNLRGQPPVPAGTNVGQKNTAVAPGTAH